VVSKERGKAADLHPPGQQLRRCVAAETANVRAAEGHTAQTKISRLLNKELGKGFASLLTEKRIAEAKILLETTMLKTSEIAEKVGYPNPRYFQQVFCSKMEMTPSEYRQIAAAFHES